MLIQDKKFQRFIRGHKLETAIELQLAKAAFEHLSKKATKYEYDYRIMKVRNDKDN